MNCPDCQETLEPLLDGELPAAAADAAREHLAGCAECAREWRTLQRLWEALEAANEVAPSTGFVERTVRSALAARDSAPPLPSWVFWRWSRPRWTLAAASLCAVVLAALWLGRTPAPPQNGAWEVAVHREFFRDMELIANLDWLADLDVIEKLDTLVEVSDTHETP